jgi:hypothetical protein
MNSNETCRKINICTAAWKSMLQNRTHDGERNFKDPNRGISMPLTKEF